MNDDEVGGNVSNTREPADNADRIQSTIAIQKSRDPRARVQQSRKHVGI